MESFVAAAVQVAPVPGPLTGEAVAANVAVCLDAVRRTVTSCGAELVVLPEAATTGFTPGLPVAELGALVGPVPGPSTAPFAQLAQELGIHLVLGTYEQDRDRVYNTAVLLGPDGELAGRYRKTHLFPGEHEAHGGWVTPGTDPVVVDTALGRIGLMICFDGDFPELARLEAIRGAEVICRPSALLRSADIWELTNRARAYDNHVYVIGANAIGTDPGGLFYFGNSMIVTPIGEVIARGASHPGWVAARLDPAVAMASLTPGSSVPHRFDHLADRNLAMLAAHAAELRQPATTNFPHSDEGADGAGRVSFRERLS